MKLVPRIKVIDDQLSEQIMLLRRNDFGNKFMLITTLLALNSFESGNNLLRGIDSHNPEKTAAYVAYAIIQTATNFGVIAIIGKSISKFAREAKRK